jgi:predicted nucleic acid-binding protein
MRYQAANGRRLHKRFAELERLQRQRKGEYLPPPLKVAVDGPEPDWSGLKADASVAGKWFLPGKGETLLEEAFRLFHRYAAGEVHFLVPDLFWAELGNLFWKAVRQKRWTQTSAEAALTALQERMLPTISSLVLLDLAFRIATVFDRTV